MEETRYFTPPGTRLGSTNALARLSTSEASKSAPRSPHFTALPTPPVDSLNISPTSPTSSTVPQITQSTGINDSLPLMSSIPAYLRFPIPPLDRLYAALKTPFPAWYSKSHVLNTAPEDLEALRQRHPFPENGEEGELEDEMPRGYPYDTVGGAAFFAWEYVMSMSNLALKWMEKQDRMRSTT
ncbi:hypothetical protein MMC30_007859 [Trapelia coarctata]|nr:hypothetical protein [Trapelia coarctata]